MVLLAGGLLARPSAAMAQDAPAPAKRAAGDAGDDAIPPPEDVSLSTADGLKLEMTYFPGRKGKDSIPVILLHAWKGSRQDFVKDEGLASYLQDKLGCAVVVPDLRGHGESTSIKNGKKTDTLKAEKLTPAQFNQMVTQDLMAVKDFLWEKNNAKQLNIDKLCVVGIEMGASLALNYAVMDAVGYDQGQWRFGPLKLGRFVKAVVLISPDMSFRGLNIKPALNAPEIRKNLPVLVLVGKGNPTRAADAKRVYDMFKTARPPAADEKLESQTVWFKRLDTSLQGIKLVDEASLDVPKWIGRFLYFRLVKNPDAADYRWEPRTLPHQAP